MDTTNSSRELHLTVANEDYLECMVRIESEEGETNGVRSVDIAQRLGVSKASVNKAVSALKASELVEQSHYGKVPKNWLKPSIRCVAGLCPTRMEKICVG